MIRKLFSVLVAGCALVASTVYAQAEKTKMAPGMILRVWSEVDAKTETVADLVPFGGVIDTGDTFESARLHKISTVAPALKTGGDTYCAVEWSGYVKIEEAGKYVLSVSHDSYIDQATFFASIGGKDVLSFVKKKSNVGAKQVVLTLQPGYHPITFLSVQRNANTRVMSFEVKIRPADEIDAPAMKVKDFFYQKK
ncbi:MAG: hypothetical protein E7031_08855 [Akkermansiaceae bacterium]|nr:hypothetical protein [Akkermansiaceae bacterium]